jgi:hypothetical protein
MIDWVWECQEEATLLAEDRESRLKCKRRHAQFIPSQVSDHTELYLQDRPWLDHVLNREPFSY